MVTRNLGRTGRLLPSVLLVLVAACAASPIENPGSRPPGSNAPSASAQHLPTSAEPPFYHPSADAKAHAARGHIIDAIEIIAPGGLRAWTVVYGSIGLDAKSVAVSGLIVAPSKPPTRGGYPVVAWAHGTSGIADMCAPSRRGIDGLPPELVALAGAGYVVTATDYEGLGTDGIHPYIIGISEGRSVLDSIRAVQSLPDAHAADEAVVVGLSQGGHATLWAAQLAPTYAPELAIHGALAASPPADLSAWASWTFDRAAGDVFTTFAPMLLFGVWSKTYGLSLPFLTDTALGIAANVPDGCDPSGLTANPFLSDPSLLPDWSQRLAENSPGAARTGVPILVVAPSDDELVWYDSQLAGVDALCAIGDQVELRTVTGGHDASLFSSSGWGAAQEWITARFAGEAATSTCNTP